MTAPFRKLGFILIPGLLLYTASCSKDTPESDHNTLKPVVSKAACPVSISSDGEDLFIFRYDDKGRMTYMSLDGQLEYSIYYDPLRIRIGDDVYNTTLTNTRINEAGFITEASVIEEGDVAYRYLFRYDADNRLVEMILNGVSNLSAEWNNGNLIRLHSHTGNEIFTYTSVENPAGAVSPFWGALAPLWFTGLFGVVPAHFPDSSVNPDHTLDFTYTLNSNHSINYETIGYDSYTLPLSYNYGPVQDIGDYNDVASFRLLKSLNFPAKAHRIKNIFSINGTYRSSSH